ncbi:MAG: ATP-binding protein [Pseudomonadota bacterium]
MAKLASPFADRFAISGASKRRRFLWLFLPAWLLLTCLFAGVVTYSRGNSQRELAQANLNQARKLAHLTRVEIKALVSNALLLRAQPSLLPFLLGGDTQAMAALAKSFLSFCQSKTGFREVMLLDDGRHELLKVESRLGRQLIVPEPMPSRQVSDPHLAAAAGLAPNELLIYSIWQTPAGQSEPEWLVRVVLPVNDDQGRLRGALAASYAGLDLVMGLQDEATAQEAGFLLVNGQGLCLYSSHPGFRPGQDLGPLWSSLQAGAQGFVRLDDAQYTFTTVKPMLEGLRYSTGAAEGLLTSATAGRLLAAQAWKLAVRQPLAAWPASWRAALLYHLPWYLATALGLGVLGWALAVTMVNREEGERQERLTQERSRIRSAFDHAAIGMAVVSLDCRFLEVNHYLCGALAQSKKDLVGRGFGSYLEADDHQFLLRRLPLALAGDNPNLRRELTLIAADGQRRIALVSISLSRDTAGQPLHFIVHALDITENKRIAAEKEAVEAELRRAQKLEAIGILAGGIAHDFNNILGIMCANAELVLQDPSVSPSPQTHRRLERLLRAGERGRGTVAQILSFCQPQDEERQSLHLAEAVAESLKLLEASLPKQVSIDTALTSPGPCVRATQGELQQIVTNLVVNASQAIEPGRGAITVTVESVTVAHPLPLVEGVLEPGAWARLSVRDTGCGMDPQTLGKVFDPFFTTKEKGKGTGLGLTTIQRIVGGLGGCIGASSRPGQGSVFHVYLPPSEPAQETAADPPPAVNVRQAGSLMIVDDEADYLEALRELMELHGYTVAAHSDPLQAWQEFQARPREFCALVSDNHMEGMSGAELARRANQLRPDLPIILCSGSYHDLVFDDEREMGVCRILRKPFTMAQLQEALNQALGPRQSQAESFQVAAGQGGAGEA